MEPIVKGKKTKESHTGISLMRKKVKNEVKLKKKIIIIIK